MIGPSWVFNVYSRLNGDTNFKAGTYELRKNMGVSSAVKAMKKGPHVAYVKLTIPPGFWLKQIAARVGSLPGQAVDPFVEATQNNAVRSAFEAPEPQQPRGSAVARHVQHLGRRGRDPRAVDARHRVRQEGRRLGLANANVQGHGSYDIIKIASLVEAEAKIDADRPLIASVIYNRLARGMPLQIDATLIYARRPRNRSLSNADKLINSPYNTYAHTGCRRRRSRR